MANNEKNAVTLDRDHYFALLKRTPQELGAIQYFYNRLSIIDSKVSALLLYNNILLFIGVTISRSVTSLTNNNLWVPVSICTLCWLTSIGHCFFTKGLSWDRMGENDEPIGYIGKISDITDTRTKLYNRALLFSFITSITILFVFFLL